MPYGTLPSRHADLDHTIPYRQPHEDDPPLEPRTGLHNLNPLARNHHLAKTHHGFVMHQPLPGIYYWRTPTGYWYRVDRLGTRSLGTATPPVIDGMAGETGFSTMELHFRRIVADHAA